MSPTPPPWQSSRCPNGTTAQTRLTLVVRPTVRSHALGHSCPFAEFTYPRTLDWSLDDYARAAADLLVQAGIPQAWILAESFGSQIAWPLAAAPRPFTPLGLILAGGFGRYPVPPVAALGARITARLPLKWFNDPLRLYAWIARWRFRAQP
jgi:pimeloyl-ACP methyl ester carboxylesterase